MSCRLASWNDPSYTRLRSPRNDHPRIRYTGIRCAHVCLFEKYHSLRNITFEKYHIWEISHLRNITIEKYHNLCGNSTYLCGLLSRFRSYFCQGIRWNPLSCLLSDVLQDACGDACSWSYRCYMLYSATSFLPLASELMQKVSSSMREETS